jgi:hypothetical protein
MVNAKRFEKQEVTVFNLIIRGVAFAAALLVSVNQAVDMAGKIASKMTAARMYISKCRYRK